MKKPDIRNMTLREKIAQTMLVNLYTPDERVQRAFVAAVYGESPFKGVAPLNMEV